MANISNFIGNCTFKKSDITRVEKLFEISKDFWYSIQAPNLALFSTHETEQTADTYTVEICGKGKWSADNTLGRLFETVFVTNPDLKDNQLFENLELDFKYREFEPNAKILRNVILQLKCVNGETLVTNCEETNLEFTSENATQFGNHMVDTFSENGIKGLIDRLKLQVGETDPNGVFSEIIEFVNTPGITTKDIAKMFKRNRIEFIGDFDVLLEILNDVDYFSTKWD